MLYMNVCMSSCALPFCLFKRIVYNNHSVTSLYGPIWLKPMLKKKQQNKPDGNRFKTSAITQQKNWMLWDAYRKAKLKAVMFLEFQRTVTCHSMTPHSSHLVFCLEGGQERSSDSNPIYHGTELQHDGLLFQAFWQLWEFICLNRRLTDARGSLLRGQRSRHVFFGWLGPVDQDKEWETHPVNPSACPTALGFVTEKKKKLFLFHLLKPDWGGVFSLSVITPGRRRWLPFW